MRRFLSKQRSRRIERFRALVRRLSMISFLLIAMSASSLLAGDDSESGFSKSHQMGIRLGAWANKGGSPLDSVPLPDPAEYYLTDFNSANFYFEGFFGYRFNSLLMAEFSVGVVSRGDVTLSDITGDSFGTLLVYPVLAKAKVYPLGQFGGRFNPYGMIGLGVYYGKHDVQIVNSGNAFTHIFEEASQTSIDYVVGAGFDWPLASMIGLEGQAQYMPISFSNELIDVDDYSSLTITVGVKYLFSSKK